MKSNAVTFLLITIVALLPLADSAFKKGDGVATTAIFADGHAVVASSAEQAGRRELLVAAAKGKVKCSKPNTGVCAMAGYPGCQKPRIYCSGACCIDTHEYSCCGGIMCCKVGACFRNVTTRTWGCCPIGFKACGGPKPGSRCCRL
ncbi:unnamed protein product [Closterium sp. NIES-53]